MGYYMGDYYAGDPGFFSFLGRIAKTAVGFIPGVGPIAKGAIDVGQSAIAKIAGSRVAKGAVSAISKHPVLSAAAGAGAVGAVSGRMSTGTPAAAGAASMRRMRGGGVGGRRRRMRVTNPKALRRAIRRAEGFKRLAMRVLRFSGPHRPRGRAYFKPRRRKK